jgi:hypothetical protein
MLHRQPWETETHFRKRIVADIRAACTELTYEIETDKPSNERIEQMKMWLDQLAAMSGSGQ